MNEFFEKLLNMKNKINGYGFLTLPPLKDEGELNIRVEWFLSKKYSFDMIFTKKVIEDSRIDLYDEFIEIANREYDKAKKQDALDF